MTNARDRIAAQLRGLPANLRPRSHHIQSFAARLVIDQRRRRTWLQTLERPDLLDAQDIVRLIDGSYRDGDENEALWRIFLAGHFGRTSAGDMKLSAGNLLFGFGGSPMWSWRAIAEDPESFHSWLNASRTNLGRLGFGNHRKFESKQPDGMFQVVWSFLEWVREAGGQPREAFASPADLSREQRFDHLFKRVSKIRRFGRTGAFDLLCLAGDLGVLKIRPGSCYIEGSTGPMAGAVKLWGSKSSKDLSDTADAVAVEIDQAPQIFEDALCNWQKAADRPCDANWRGNWVLTV